MQLEQVGNFYLARKLLRKSYWCDMNFLQKWDIISYLLSQIFTGYNIISNIPFSDIKSRYDMKKIWKDIHAVCVITNAQFLGLVVFPIYNLERTNSVRYFVCYFWLENNFLQCKTEVSLHKVWKYAVLGQNFSKFGLICSLFLPEIGLSSIKILKFWTRVQNRSLLIVRYWPYCM